MSKSPFDKSLAGKTALVTGASRGLGRATALRLAADGASVLIHYGRKADEAEAVVREIVAAGGKALSVQADLAGSEGVASLAEAVPDLLKRLGAERLDILVNNAGIAPFVGYAETDEKTFDEIVAVNVKAPFFLTQKLLPLIADGGRVVLLSSAVTRTYFPGIVAYAMLKGPIDVFARYLAAELGERGITVNAISPGAIDTDMSAWLRSDEGVTTAHSIQALKRVGQADDIARAVAFVAGPDSGWVTGQVIDASGGTKL